MGHSDGHHHDPVTEAQWAKERAQRNRGEIWWSNGIFFISVHIFAIVGTINLSPLTSIDKRTAILCFISWQLASFGVTIGYHRLWSHRAFTATLPLRIVLAWMGSMGFQGSVKWWVLRHRLHHRFTDSPIHDPYSATNGLWYAHCGWIFRKPAYPRMKLIERSDLESDPVVRFQHKYYVQIALFSGLILPCLIAKWGWNDGIGGLVWGGAVARLLIWHTTFCINSLAHWTGLQPYTEEVTAKGNYLLALLTSGEGNHNFHHAFPKDFRNGPHPADWDPTKWIIWALHKYTPFIPSIACTPETAIHTARAKVHMAHADRLFAFVPPSERVKQIEELPVWSPSEVLKRHGQRVGSRRRVLLLVEGCIVDVGGYIDDHPGGEQLLLSHAVRPLPENFALEPVSSSTSTSDAEEEDEVISSGSSDDSAGTTSSTRISSIEKRDARNEMRARRAQETATSAQDSGYFSGSGEIVLEEEDEVKLKDATKSFFGGMNNHSGAAKERMRCLRVARLG